MKDLKLVTVKILSVLSHGLYGSIISSRTESRIGKLLIAVYLKSGSRISKPLKASALQRLSSKLQVFLQIIIDWKVEENFWYPRKNISNFLQSISVWSRLMLISWAAALIQLGERESNVSALANLVRFSLASDHLIRL